MVSIVKGQNLIHQECRQAIKETLPLFCTFLLLSPFRVINAISWRQYLEFWIARLNGQWQWERIRFIQIRTDSRAVCNQEISDQGPISNQPACAKTCHSAQAAIFLFCKPTRLFPGPPRKCVFTDIKPGVGGGGVLRYWMIQAAWWTDSLSFWAKRRIPIHFGEILRFAQNDRSDHQAVGIKRSPDRGVARRVTGAQRDYRFSMVDDWSIW